MGKLSVFVRRQVVLHVASGVRMYAGNTAHGRHAYYSWSRRWGRLRHRVLLWSTGKSDRRGLKHWYFTVFV